MNFFFSFFSSSFLPFLLFLPFFFFFLASKSCFSKKEYILEFSSAPREGKDGSWVFGLGCLGVGFWILDLKDLRGV